MAGYPAKCPSCGEPNNANLHYCPVCGVRFQRSVPNSNNKAPSKKALSKEQKMKIKKLKKKKELIELYKRKKISNEQFAKGMAKLGYSTDIEKAMEFKKYIKAQIQAFEKMDVSGAQEGGYHFDPNESKAQLPRDQHGNVITDFSVGPTRAPAQPVYKETYTQPTMVSSRPPPATTSRGGPVFGETLFGSERAVKERAPRREVPKATLKRDVPVGRSRQVTHRRNKADLEWDEDEEEEEIVQEEEIEEEEFEIDLEDEEFQGESGWWDDEEWELDWSDEDEGEWEDWELDENEEDEWEMWEEELEHPEGVTVEFEDEDEHEEEDHDEYYHDDDEEDDEEDVFDPRDYYSEDEDDEEEEEEEEEEDDDDDDWGAPVGRRRRRN